MAFDPRLFSFWAVRATLLIAWRYGLRHAYSYMLTFRRIS